MNGRVLLVEDEPDVLEGIRMLLEGENYQVLAAQDGEEALEKARLTRPDIVILDTEIPKKNGFEVCHSLRQDAFLGLVPIIMVSSHSALKDRLTGIKLGADEYLTKPFDPQELLARVERALTRHRQALETNPQTGLAGLSVLNQEVAALLRTGEDFSLARADLNGFSQFNDVYGYDRGDGVLRLMGTVFRSALAELGNPSDRAFHLGADVFSYLSTPDKAEVIAARGLEVFSSLVQLHYDASARKNGYVKAADASGNAARLPFLTMAVGLADVPRGVFSHPAPVVDLARSAWQEAKAKGQNGFFTFKREVVHGQKEVIV